jgi:hypothetical protein
MIRNGLTTKTSYWAAHILVRNMKLFSDISGMQNYQDNKQITGEVERL